MNPKEKANELGNKFYQGSVFDYDKDEHLKERERAKERALICVDEILSEGACQYGVTAVDYGREKYWYNVKEEINTL